MQKIIDVYQDDKPDQEEKLPSWDYWNETYAKSDIVDDLEQILASADQIEDIGWDEVDEQQVADLPDLTIDLEQVRIKISPTNDYDLWQGLIKTLIEGIEKYHKETG